MPKTAAQHKEPSVSAEEHRRPHLFTLLFGMVDAHMSGVDYMDTAGGQEMRRLYQRRRALRKAAGSEVPQQRTTST